MHCRKLSGMQLGEGYVCFRPEDSFVAEDPYSLMRTVLPRAS
jgi:hypothetical protein